MSEVFAITLRKVVNFSLKAKHLAIKPEGVRTAFFPFFFILIVLLIPAVGSAQVEQPLQGPRLPLPVLKDTIPVSPDTLVIKNDTLSTQPDSLKVPPPKSDIETTIFYSASDSINSSLSGKIIKLYGNAKIKYGTIELEADEIIIDYEQSTISANGKLDSLGRRVGFPIFKSGPEVYETRDMVYNFKTKKAKISEVVTTQGDGFMHGEVVFKNAENELFTIGNAYTTCNLSHPHFRIVSKKAKAIPGDKIVTGPFYMELLDVPTPLAFIFGIFPAQRKSASGIIVPSYGEERRRGFFLRNGGYYFDISEYIKVSVTGDIYTKGSSALYLNSIYNKRYAYTGSFNFSFTNNRVTDNIEDEQKIKDFRLTWSHSPQTRGTSRFSASVNAATSSFTNNNFLGLNNDPRNTRLDNTSRKLSSNVSYSKTFPGTPFNLGINMRHNQDLVTKRLDMSLPDLTFNVNNIYPFKRNSKKDFLQNMSVRYTLTGTNQINNNLGRIGNATTDSIAPFTFGNFPTFLRNSRKGIRHVIPIATSVKALKYLTLSPAINFNELWYFEKLNWGINDAGNTPIVIDTLREFNRVTNYSIALNLTTRIYGMYFIRNPNSRLKAIRHIINPSIGYSYQPDFGDPKFGFFQELVTEDGKKIRRSRHEGFIFGSSGQGERSSLSFSIGNNLEMKVKNERDSVARKVSLLNNLSISSSYNFAADSFKLAPFSLSANSNIMDNKFNVNLTAVLDPYQFRLDSIGTQENNLGTIFETKISRFVWQDGFAIGQITNLNLALSTNLSPKGNASDQTTRDRIAKSNISETDKQFFLNNPDAYVDFNVPWNLRISYNLDYAKQGRQDARVTQALRFNGDLSLTEQWKIGFNSGYDFESKAITQTFLTLNRDLHCWQMSLGWVPFGAFQSYNFSIGVKSGLLRDLKLDRRSPFFDNR